MSDKPFTVEIVPWVGEPIYAVYWRERWGERAWSNDFQSRDAAQKHCDELNAQYSREKLEYESQQESK